MAGGRLVSAKVKNFRSIREANLSFLDYSCLLGKNDTGKSSLLHALNILFDPSLSTKADDVCRIEGEDGQEAYVEARLEGFVAEHPCLKDGTAVLRLDLHAGKRSAWGLTPRIEALRQMKVGDFTKGQLTKVKDFPDGARTIIDGAIAPFENATTGRVSPTGWIRAYEELRAKGLVEFEEGWDPISDEDLRGLVVPIFLAASLRAEEEFSDSSETALGRVGGFLVRQAARGHEGLRAANANLEQQIAELSTRKADGTWEFEPLNQLEASLSKEVKLFDPEVDVEAKITPPKLRPLSFGLDVGVHDKFVHDVTRLGHGMQRTAIFALVAVPQQLTVTQGEPPPLPLHVFLIEEPELYLHPQAERRRVGALRNLSEVQGAQVVVATHSAFFVDMRNYRGISRFSRPNRLASVIEQWTGPDLDADAKELLKAVRYFNPTRSAMLFADLVVLVEGPTEQLMLPILAERMGLETGNVEVVECGGFGDLDLFAKILQGFRMKYVVWPDKDAKEKIKTLKELIDPAYGQLVIPKRDWETMAQPGAADSSKPWRSYRHFVINGNEPNDLTKECIRSAYEWRSFDASQEGGTKK